MASDQLNIRIDGDLKKAFMERAKENGTTATELLVEFMKEYLGYESNRFTGATVDITAIKAELAEYIDTRLDNAIQERYLQQFALVETRLSERLDSRIAEIEQRFLGESAALSEPMESLGQEVENQEKFAHAEATAAIPDMYAIRDRVLQSWRVAKRAESKERIQEALDKFISALTS